MKNRMRLILSALTGGVMLLSAPAMAVDVPIKITGTVYIPPCKIKNDTDFKVSFGKIALQKVDGRNYAQPTTVEVNCEYFQENHISVCPGEQVSFPVHPIMC